MDTKNEEARRGELEQNGLANVKLSCRAPAFRDRQVRGFKDPRYDPRGFVEDWIAEEEKMAAEERRSTRFWAIVAAGEERVGYRP